jgi:hypothetical protein
VLASTLLRSQRVRQVSVIYTEFNFSTMSGNDTDADLARLVADTSVTIMPAVCRGARRGDSNDQDTWDEDSLITGHPVTVLS